MNDRLVIFMVYIYLAFRHSVFIKEFKEVYEDYTAGKRARLIQEKKARMFNLDKSN